MVHPEIESDEKDAIRVTHFPGTVNSYLSKTVAFHLEFQNARPYTENNRLKKENIMKRFIPFAAVLFTAPLFARAPKNPAAHLVAGMVPPPFEVRLASGDSLCFKPGGEAETVFSGNTIDDSTFSTRAAYPVMSKGGLRASVSKMAAARIKTDAGGGNETGWFYGRLIYTVANASESPIEIERLDLVDQPASEGSAMEVLGPDPCTLLLIGKGLFGAIENPKGRILIASCPDGKNPLRWVPADLKNGLMKIPFRKPAAGNHGMSIRFDQIQGEKPTVIESVKWIADDGSVLAEDTHRGATTSPLNSDKSTYKLTFAKPIPLAAPGWLTVRFAPDSATASHGSITISAPRQTRLTAWLDAKKTLAPGESLTTSIVIASCEPEGALQALEHYRNHERHYAWIPPADAEKWYAACEAVLKETAAP